MDTVSTTPSKKLRRTDAKGCLCHCRGASGKLVDFTEANWQTLKNAAEIRRDVVLNNFSSRFDEGPFGGYHRLCYQKYTNKTLLSRFSRPDDSSDHETASEDDDDVNNLW